MLWWAFGILVYKLYTTKFLIDGEGPQIVLQLITIKNEQIEAALNDKFDDGDPVKELLNNVLAVKGTYSAPDDDVKEKWTGDEIVAYLSGPRLH